MKNEADVKRAMVKDLKSRGCYARRIEDAFSVGFPDMVVLIPDYPFFPSEVKMIRGNKFGPTGRQHEEMNRMLATGAAFPVWVGWKEGKHYMYPHSPALNHVTADQCVKQGDDENIVDLYKRTYNLSERVKNEQFHR